jgi:hypothetical protein
MYNVWLLKAWNDFIANIPVLKNCMKGLTFEVVLFSGYTLRSAMLPLLETFVEILCPNTFSLIITFF